MLPAESYCVEPVIVSTRLVAHSTAMVRVVPEVIPVRFPKPSYRV
jgi:hypothetical protein